jgi:hypothetical protein
MPNYRPCLDFRQTRMPSFRDAPLGAGPESILTIVVMDSGLALRAPRNDDPEGVRHVSTNPVLEPLAAESLWPCGSAR